jgi:hypothetical protein
VRPHPRYGRDLARFLHGLQLVEPGLVWLPQWRPNPADQSDFAQPEASAFLAGVGRKPANGALTPASASPDP